MTKTSNPRRPVFTIGHSTTPEDKFLAWLKRHEVDVLLDVRSSPFSRHAPQFNRSTMTGWLGEAGVRYVFGGTSLGGRPTDQTLYESGRANYERMRESPAFIAGLRKLVVLARTHSVALLCAEAEPLECHRFLLVSRALHAAGVCVAHILPGGAIESHEAAEQRLVRVLGLSQVDLFNVSENAIRNAYKAQENRVAFRNRPGRPEPRWGSA